MCILGLNWRTITNGKQGEEKQLLISHIGVRNEQARDMMVARKADVDSYDFLGNYFLNYSLNILDSGRVAGDILCETKTMHRGSNRINRSHHVLFVWTVYFSPSLKF